MMDTVFEVLIVIIVVWIVLAERRMKQFRAATKKQISAAKTKHLKLCLRHTAARKKLALLGRKYMELFASFAQLKKDTKNELNHLEFQLEDFCSQVNDNLDEIHDKIPTAAAAGGAKAPAKKK